MDLVVDDKGFNWESVWDEEWEQNLLDVANERIKKKIEPKAYQIFDLYVVKGWQASKVAKTLGVNITRVYLTKHRVSKRLHEEIVELREELRENAN